MERPSKSWITSSTCSRDGAGGGGSPSSAVFVKRTDRGYNEREAFKEVMRVGKNIKTYHDCLLHRIHAGTLLEESFLIRLTGLAGARRRQASMARGYRRMNRINRSLAEMGMDAEEEALVRYEACAGWERGFGP